MRNGLQVWHLNTCTPVGGALWEGVGDTAVVETVRHQEPSAVFEIKNFLLLQIVLSVL